MKKIYFVIFALSLLASCANPVINTSPAPATDTPPVVITAPVGLSGNVKAIFYDGTSAKLWDGSNFVSWQSGGAIRASGHDMVIAIGPTLYTVDKSGSAVANSIIPASSSAIAIQPKSVAARALGKNVSITSGNNVWTFSDVTQEEMDAAGGYRGSWSHVFKNGVEQLPWFQFTVIEALVAANGDVIVRDDHYNRYTDLTNPKGTVIAASDNGPIMWQNNQGDTTFYMTDATGSTAYQTGAYFSNPYLPHKWFQHAGVWYNTNGMKWTPGGDFVNLGTKLTDFLSGWTMPAWENYNNSQIGQTFLQYAGEYTGLIYLIDPCSGWLISFDAESNLYAPVVQMWIGQTNDNSPGYALAKTIMPQLIDGAIYWHKSGSIWKTDITSKMTVNFAPDQQMWVMP